MKKPLINYQSLPKQRKNQRGVMLIEALVAVMIFSMGILALVGLQAAMIKNTSENKYRADASFIAQERIGRLWADPTNLVSNNSATTQLPNGNIQVIVRARGLVDVVVTWQAPGSDAHRYQTSTYIGDYQ